MLNTCQLLMPATTLRWAAQPADTRHQGWKMSIKIKSASITVRICAHILHALETDIYPNGQSIWVNNKQECDDYKLSGVINRRVWISVISHMMVSSALSSVTREATTQFLPTSSVLTLGKDDENVVQKCTTFIIFQCEVLIQSLNAVNLSNLKKESQQSRTFVAILSA